MYDKKIEKLIEISLKDGKINQKEKDVLLKKAKEFDIDPHEFEIVLESRLLEKQEQLKKEKTADSAVKKFLKKYENLPNTIKEEKLYYNKKKEERNTLEEEDVRNEKLKEKRVNLIDSFIIPEDISEIIEFLIIATPSAKYYAKIQSKKGIKKILSKMNAALMNENKRDVSEAWLKKCQQAIMKANHVVDKTDNDMKQIKYFAQELNI